MDDFVAPNDDGVKVVYREVEGRSVTDNWVSSWKNWLNWSGRARREEWWTIWFANAIAWIPISFVLLFVPDVISQVLQWVLTIPFVIATASLTVRRVHDIGLRAPFALLALVPLLGLFFLLLDSHRDPNEYGPSPKYARVESVS